MTSSIRGNDNFDSGNELTIQEVITEDGNVATGTTIMPTDDTIPQNTEGDEYITRQITPTDANSKLIIEARVYISNTFAGAHTLNAAIFQDAIADALAVGSVTAVNANYVYEINIKAEIIAGTTSTITFKVRAGGDGAGTTTFNGSGGIRRFGGVLNSWLKVKEVNQ